MSPTQRGTQTVAIEQGQVINVDVARFTVDVRTSRTHRLLLDLKVGAPYLHYNAGEGFSVMPEVGALVQVCLPSDDVPFILCFVTAFERADTDTSSEQSQATFRAGRPDMEQGDMLLRTRDGNQLWLHRGGVVEIGATRLAQRVYVPLTNLIRDVFENYEALSTAGEMYWTTTRSDSDPDDTARAVFTVGVRDAAQDSASSVMVKLGHVDDTIRVRCVVAPNSIDSRTGEVDGDAVYELTINEDGDVAVTTAGDVTADVDGELELTVSGEANVTTGNRTDTVNGNLSVQVSGEHELRAATSRETVSGSKVLDSPLVLLGGPGAHDAMMLVTSSVIAFMAAHTHDVLGSATGPPSPSVTPAQMSARRVKGV